MLEIRILHQVVVAQAGAGVVLQIYHHAHHVLE